jgi:hypothetical protein
MWELIERNPRLRFALTFALAVEPPLECVKLPCCSGETWKAADEPFSAHDYVIRWHTVIVAPIKVEVLWELHTKILELNKSPEQAEEKNSLLRLLFPKKALFVRLCCCDVCVYVSTFFYKKL